MYSKDLDYHRKWEKVLDKIENAVGKRPRDINAVLFIIGVHELGKGAKSYTKEEKQDLIHIAICKILSFAGYYELEGIDSDGWPHWKLIKKLPYLDIIEQEKLLKIFIIDYFEKEIQL
jgi:hypothetical protein